MSKHDDRAMECMCFKDPACEEIALKLLYGSDFVRSVLPTTPLVFTIDRREVERYLIKQEKKRLSIDEIIYEGGRDYDGDDIAINTEITNKGFPGLFPDTVSYIYLN